MARLHVLGSEFWVTKGKRGNLSSRCGITNEIIKGYVCIFERFLRNRRIMWWNIRWTSNTVEGRMYVIGWFLNINRAMSTYRYDELPISNITGIDVACVAYLYEGCDISCIITAWCFWIVLVGYEVNNQNRLCNQTTTVTEWCTWSSTRVEYWLNYTRKQRSDKSGSKISLLVIYFYIKYETTLQIRQDLIDIAFVPLLSIKGRHHYNQIHGSC